MRSNLLLTLTLTLAACSNDPAEPAAAAAGLFAGEGRDALCIVGPPGQQRAGFIAYGKGGTNCSARGRIQPQDADFALVPTGEGECRIPFKMDGGQITLGASHPSCAYYCGPGAAFDGKSFRRVSPSDPGAAANNPMVDLAGDPLC